jgi:CubicO group peptidase (beta-lactamase class C family)
MTDTARRNTLKGLAATLGAAVLPGCASNSPSALPLRQGDHAAALTQLQTWLGERMKQLPHANLSIAVLDGDQVTWSTGLGMADPTQKIAASAHTRYRAGSISKVFTAMAAMQLAEQGRLDLDAPLATVLPGFRMRSRFPEGGPVTPRLILQHRSGLPSDWAEGMWTDSPEDFGRLVHTLRDTHMAFPPGAVHAYCNVGFTLLGAAIQHITGERFENWMQRQWLDSMGMGDSAFEVAPPSGPQAAAALNAKGKVEHEPSLRDLPAGGLNSTVLDLLQLARLWFAKGSLTGRSLLNQSSITAMQTLSSPPALGDYAPIGLGWFLLDDLLDGVGPVLSHAGGTPHHHAQLMLLPRLKLAVSVMSSTQNAGELAQEAAIKALTLMATARTGVDPTRAQRTDIEPIYPPAALERYVGDYDTPMGMIRIERDAQQLSVQAMGKHLRLAPTADGYTRLQYRLLGLIPINLGQLDKVVFTRHDTVDGQAWLLARNKGGFSLAGTQLPPLPIPAAWQQRLGQYNYTGGDSYLAKDFKALRLIEDAGLLVAEVQADDGVMRLALAPLNDDEATLRGLGRSRGDTVYASLKDGQTVLRCAGMSFVRQAVG